MRPTAGARAELHLHCSGLQRVTLDISESLVSPAWLRAPNCRGRWTQVLRGLGRVGSGGCMGWRMPGDGAQTTPSVASGRLLKGVPIQPFLEASDEDLQAA